MTVFADLFKADDQEKPNLNGVLKEASEKLAKERHDLKVAVVALVISHVSNIRKKYVEELRAARRVENEAKRNMVNVELAAKYFEATGNFGPLWRYLNSRENIGIHHHLRNLGIESPTLEDQQMPENWQPV